MSPTRTITQVVLAYNFFQVNYISLKDSIQTEVPLSTGQKTGDSFESQTQVDIAQSDGFQFYGFTSHVDASGALVSLEVILYSPTSLNSQYSIVE